ncbi:MAG: hypothetical protein ABSB60_13815 [Terracidiphilus sp.]|jgi:hypothetical protein
MSMGAHWQFIRSASAVFCFFFVTCATAAEAQSGLLLGLSRSRDEKGRDIPDRTLWIAPQDGKLQIMELPDLIVPRKTGFWRVGTRFYCDADEVKNHPHKEPSPNGAFFAAPVSERPTIYGVVQCPAHVQYLDTEGICGDDVPDGASGVDISFVNGEYVSLNDWWRTDCGGHPDGGSEPIVERLGDPSRTRIAYGEIEGQGAADKYARQAADALFDNYYTLKTYGHRMPMGEGDTEEDAVIRKSFPGWSTMNDVEKVTALGTVDDQCFPKHDDREWQITRGQGRWTASGSIHTHRLCGGEVDFELPFHAKFAASDAGPISLDAIRNQIAIKDLRDLTPIKGVIDVLWAPNHAFLTAFIDMDGACISNQFDVCLPRDSEPEFAGKTLMQVYLPRGQVLGKPVISLQLKEFEKLVMAEGATGSSVARWTAALKKIEVEGVVKPMLASSPQR